MPLIEVREYIAPNGRSPFRAWFERLHAPARVKVAASVYRVGLGNYSNAKSVGAGVFERRVNFGPG